MGPICCPMGSRNRRLSGLVTNERSLALFLIIGVMVLGACRPIASMTTDRFLPSNCGEAVLTRTAWAPMSCVVAEYAIAQCPLELSFPPGITLEKVPDGLPLSSYVEAKADGFSLGNTILDGKYCINDDDFRSAYLATMRSEEKVLFHTSGMSTVVAYDRKIGRLYVVAGE
jgi:hypothetical protein